MHSLLLDFTAMFFLCTLDKYLKVEQNYICNGPIIISAKEIVFSSVFFFCFCMSVFKKHYSKSYEWIAMHGALLYTQFEIDVSTSFLGDYVHLQFTNFPVGSFRLFKMLSG